MFFGNNPTFLLLIFGLLLALWAQWKVKAAFAKYSKVPAASGLTGAEVAEKLLQHTGVEVGTGAISDGAALQLRAVQIEAIAGNLTDHYDPRAKILRLSEPVYSGRSLAALGIAAHETGHALQHATGYSALGLRSTLLPAANIGSTLAFPLFFIGLILGANHLLMDLGILLYAAAVAFTLITLPVEFNASRRAIAMLKDGGYIRPDEVRPAKAVLDAAALTYLAAAVMAVLQLLRLIILRSERD
jgi:Zn-dependent membrane protease YugP